MPAISYVNLFAHDVEALARFYALVFGFAEIEAVRSPIFRAVDAGGCRIGFNAHAAYGLLDLADQAHWTGTSAMLTIDVGSASEVDHRVAAAVSEGAELVKPPYRTAYHTYQAVLFDPEGHVVRINAALPEGG